MNPLKKKVQVQQHMKNDCDINQIVARNKVRTYQETNPRIAKFGDFSNLGNYQEMHERVKRAEDAFAALPAKIRDRFENNPAKLVEYVNGPDSPEKRAELDKLGLITRIEDPKPEKINLTPDQIKEGKPTNAQSHT